MNRIYRLLFNRELGCVQVVSELVSHAQSGASAPPRRASSFGVVPALRFALWLAMGWVMALPAMAQSVEGRITGDANAPGGQRPTVIAGPNGIPVVNITTPSAAGVSRNTYSQFDVGNNGAILNNARTSANTQLAGEIAGNPWLATGSAKVILNEVNSASPSHLNGYVEVAGKRAEVIIANPAGIAVNGGGFLNASRVTLTTGQPLFNAGGSLEGYRVSGGAISVDGKGLDATQTDYTALITRSLHLNAGVWAKQVQASLGANHASVDGAQVLRDAATGGAPQFALDVSALGGMYAQHIALIGTEAGVGVRNAGTLGAHVGDLVVTVDGRLENSGTLQAKQDTVLTARGALANAGTVSAARELKLTTSADVDNSGGTLNARRTEVNAAALQNRDGVIEQTGLQELVLDAGTLSNRDGGRIGVAEGNGSGGNGGGSSADQTGGEGERGASGGANVGGTLPDLIPLPTGALRIAGVLNNDGGRINAGGGVQLRSTQGLDNSGGHLGLRELMLTQGALTNVDGRLDITGAATVHTQMLDNTHGAFNVGSSLDVQVQEWRNAGGALVHSGRTATLLAASTLDNSGGSIASNADALTLTTSGVLDNRGGTLLAAHDMALHAASVDNSGGTAFAQHDLRYESAAGTLINRGGQWGAGNAAWLTVASISNTGEGRIQAGAVWLTTPTLDIGGGEIAGNEVHARLTRLSGLGRLYGTRGLEVDFSGDYVHASGQRLETDGLLDVAVAGTLTNQGALESSGELTLSATSLINQGRINASHADGTARARIDVSGALSNARGASVTGDGLQVSAHTLTNIGEIVGDAVSLSADLLTNGRDLDAAQAGVTYGEGFIGAAERLDLRVGQRLDNLDADIFSGGGVTISGRSDGARVGEVRNVSARIQAEGDVVIATDRVDNARRLLATQTYTLTPDEQYVASFARQYDQAWAALTDSERQRVTVLNGRPANQLSNGEIAEKKALNRKLGWQHVDHVSDEMLAALNDWYNTVGAPTFGASGGYLVDNAATPDDNPGAEVVQRDTYTTGTRLDAARTSAESQLLSGGDLTLDVTQRVRNHASRIAAGGALRIAGQGYDGAVANTRIENIAVVSELSGQRQTQAWVYPEVPVKYWKGGLHDTIAEVIGYRTEAVATTGAVLAAASLTAGQGLSIEGGDVSNTAVTSGNGLSTFGIAAAQGHTVHAGHGPSSPAAQVVGTVERPLPGLLADDTGRFDVTADPTARFLITTAPRFAKGAPWDNSDYLLKALKADPNTLHKRLGDGYYENQLVRDQIQQLTGRRSLSGDPLTQYQRLMDSAAAEAARMGLQLGAALTSMQIAALSQDIVWLVEMEVNGQKVLAPVVYLSNATAQRLRGDDALLAGDWVDVRATGEVRNDGTFNGQRGAWLSADTLINHGAITSDAGRVELRTQGDTTNRGMLTGHAVVVDAGGDFTHTVRLDGLQSSGGVIAAGVGGAQLTAARDVVQQGAVKSQGSLVVGAGRDVVQSAATTHTAAGSINASAGSLRSTGSTVVSAGRDVVLDGSAINAGRHAVIDAGRDARFIASEVTAGNSLAINAGRDIVSETVTTAESYRYTEKKGKTRVNTLQVDETVHGSGFNAGGDVAMVAGQDIHLTSAAVTSDAGAVALAAARDVTLDTAQEQHSTSVDSHSKKSGMLSSTTTQTHDQLEVSQSIGSTVSGNTVAVQAGRDIAVVGSAVVSDVGTALVAGRYIRIEAGQTTVQEHHAIDKTKSGLMGGMGSGIGVTIGTRKQGQSMDATETLAEASVIGSTHGAVSLVAGEDVSIVGSDILSSAGTQVVGKNVTIAAAEQTLERTDRRHFQQTGVNVAAGGGAVDSAVGAYRSLERGQEVQDDRLKALYAARAAQQAANAAQSVQVSGSVSSGVNVRITAGSQRSTSDTVTQASSHRGSALRSEGDIVIAATGDGQGHGGDLRVAGSEVDGRNVGLQAAHDLTLTSSRDAFEQTTRSQSQGGEIGVAIAADSNGGGSFGLYVAANAARGKGQGEGVSYSETRINAREGLRFVSGHDTTLEGAQLTAHQVIGRVGGDLAMRSQQDGDGYQNQQMGVQGEMTVGYGFTGSASASYSKVDSDYRSVKEQTGIQAGQGGFDVDVGGHTQLDGAALVSTATADKNRLGTGSLGVSELHNRADYSAVSVSVSTRGGGGTPGGRNGGSFAPGVGVPQDEDSDSTTHSAISAGTVIVRNGDASALANTDRAQRQLSNEALAPLFDEQKVNERLELSAVAGQVGFEAVGDYAQRQTREYERAQQRKQVADQKLRDGHLTSEERAQWQGISDHASAVMAIQQSQYEQWKEGGASKTIAHAVAGAAMAGLGGGDALQGAMGAAAAELGRPLTAEEGTLVQYLLSGGLAAAAGGSSGAATGLAGEAFNRQLHPTELKKIDALAEQFARQECGCSNPSAANVDAAQDRLTAQALRQTDRTFNEQHTGTDMGAQDFLRANTGTFKDEQGRTMTLFGPGAYYGDASMYAYTKNTFGSQYAGATQWARTHTKPKPDGPWGTIGDGSLKGLVNAVPDAINSLLALPARIADPDGNQYAPLFQLPTVKYANEVEQQVAQDVTAVVGTAAALGGATLPRAPVTKPKSPGVVTAVADSEAGLPPVVRSDGAADVSSGAKYKSEIAKRELDAIAAQDPRLAAAVNGSGWASPNYTIGSGTAADANKLGRVWVGDGARELSDGSGLMSVDGTRVYRYPKEKDSRFATTGAQANFERFVFDLDGNKVKVSNGHLNVLGGRK